MSILSGATEWSSAKPKPCESFQIKTRRLQAQQAETTTEVIQVCGTCKQAFRIAEGGDWVSKSPARHWRTSLSAIPLSRGRVGRCHVEVWAKPGRLPHPSLSYLELRHLLFQIDDELLDPGVISFIVAELLLTLKYKSCCLCSSKWPRGQEWSSLREQHCTPSIFSSSSLAKCPFPGLDTEQVLVISLVFCAEETAEN